MFVKKHKNNRNQLASVAVVFVVSGALVFTWFCTDDMYDQIKHRDQKNRERDHQVQRLVDTHCHPPFRGSG